MGPLSSECLFRWEDLEDGPAHSTRTPESAIAVLSGRANRALTIYKDKDEHVKFEDRVEHFLNIFEQIFDYQVHAVGPDGSGYSSKSIPRAHFEGWDFHDLATESDPLFPRLANIASKGKSWIDLTRSIHTINLLGRGFGEILEPSSLSCPYWASLPKDQYYLAAGIAELQQMVLKYTGDLTANPIRLSENLVWYNPRIVFEFCDCADATADHADLVQVILPATLSDKLEQCNNTVNLAHNGAVVFGYNRSCQWRWGDTGDPERDDIRANDEVHFASTHNAGHDNSRTLQVGSESDYSRLSSTQAPSIKDTIVTSSADHGSARPNPLVRSYTKWNLESLRAEDYAVGIVCALPLELLAVRALFDQTHPELSLPGMDSNHYALGSIGRHKVVTACLPYGEYGTNSAADVASNLRRSFRSVKFCLLVGIGGGVPSPRNDIRLGDVVVSKPIGTSPGVIQYDMGKAFDNGVFEQNGFLQAPSRVLMTALSILESDPRLPPAPLQEYIEEITACRKEYRYPGLENDRLFSSDYAHDPKHATCDSCSIAHTTTRPSRSNHHPQIHYGLIASGNRVMKDAKLRDIWSRERDVLCFEMEAAGVMNTLPCLVIRGICDYSDSHKNKRFQEYAAATAASYAKLLLSHLKDSIDLDGTALHASNE
jgi:nucleoside phosphorylase